MNYLAAWGYALRQSKGDEGKARDFRHTAVQETSPFWTRGARLDDDVHAARMGDVMIALGERGLPRGEELGPEQVRDVVPS